MRLARGEGTYDLHDLQDVQTRGLKEELLSSRAMWDSLKIAMEEQRTHSDLNAGTRSQLPVLPPLSTPPHLPFMCLLLRPNPHTSSHRFPPRRIEIRGESIREDKYGA